MRPFSLLIKPTGPDCNLQCNYCFYTGKSSLFTPGRHRMSDEVLEKLIVDFLKLNLLASSFAWQGGEPTLMGLDFYKKVVHLQQKHGKPGQVVSNALQTNAILLDEQWCDFLNEYKFLVGISLDGPKKYHNHYRLDHSGSGSFTKVMAAIDCCRRKNVEFNILVLLNDRNVIAPDELFDFFVEQEIRYLQFTPCVESQDDFKITPYSITPSQYGDFLCRIFDRWYEYGSDKISVRIFDSILSYLLGNGHTLCTFSQKCNDYIVVEHTGDVFCCDFFVGDDYKLGNIFETPIEKLANSKRKKDFAEKKRDVHNNCFVCKYLNICRGGCLKDRTVTQKSCKIPSYFCQAYKLFFDYSLPKFMQIAANISQPK